LRRSTYLYSEGTLTKLSELDHKTASEAVVRASIDSAWQSPRAVSRATQLLSIAWTFHQALISSVPIERRSYNKMAIHWQED
jgi:hypothetical protein